MKTRFPGISPLLAALAVTFGGPMASAQAPYGSSLDFAKYAMKLREKAILQLEPKVVIITAQRPMGISSKYQWKLGIVTTTFWVGESASQNNPVHNHSSSWDVNWGTNFGGFDNPNPAARNANFIPNNFIPKQNPFYFALPYNDVTRGTTKPEAKVVIPWFKQVFEREGQSVCRDRWIAIRSTNGNGKVCYAQWSDCGPFRTDHWQYVFGAEKPKPNLNKGAGLDISPAVRDYLEISGTDVTDWKFMEYEDVPNGPWSRYGENNDFVLAKRNGITRRADAGRLSIPVPTPVTAEPTVITREKQP